jgi:predicted Zn-dependent protease
MQHASITALRLREVVSVHRALEFSWDGPRGPYAVHVVDEASLQLLRAHPALADMPQMRALRGRQKRHRIGRTLGWSALTALLLLPVLLVLAFVWQADRIAGAAARHIPVEQESKLGRQVFASMKRKLKLQDTGPAADVVRTLGERLTQGSRYRYEFHVVEDKAINAYALPGGVIVVHTGLIEAARRPEELAGVLAHEVQHVEQRHSLQSMVKELGLRGLWAAVTGDLGGTLAGQAALKLTSLRFSRDAERQADAKGFDTLVQQNIDPQGMVDFFGTMAKSGATPPAWLSTHPDSDARQQSLRAMHDALAGRAFPPLEISWPLRSQDMKTP